MRGHIRPGMPILIRDLMLESQHNPEICMFKPCINKSILAHTTVSERLHPCLNHCPVSVSTAQLHTCS